MEKKYLVEFEYDTNNAMLKDADNTTLFDEAWETIFDGLMLNQTSGILSYSLSINDEVEGAWKVTEIKGGL